MDDLKTDPAEDWKLETPEATREVADQFARSLSEDHCLGLIGPLGAGKTTFVKGIVEGLGGDGDAVRSPTYALVQRYPETTPTVVHADLYRTEGPDQQETLGLEEHFGNALTIVEWAERWSLGWPENTTTLLFEHESETTRSIHRIDASPDELDETILRSVFPSDGVLD